MFPEKRNNKYLITKVTLITLLRISQKELEFIETSIAESGTSLRKIETPTPWKEIFCSLPFLASIVCDMGNSYGLTMQATQLPSFLKDRFHLNTLHVSSNRDQEGWLYPTFQTPIVRSNFSFDQRLLK